MLALSKTIFLSLLIYLVPVVAQSAPFIFQCAYDGNLIYSDRPCGPDAEQIAVLTPYGWRYNTYSGALRPGQKTLLDAARHRESSRSFSGGTITGETYGERMDRLKQERSRRYQGRRHSSTIEKRGSSPWQ